MGQWLTSGQQNSILGSVPMFAQGKVNQDDNEMNTRTKQTFIGLRPPLGKSSAALATFDRRIFKPNWESPPQRESNILQNSDIPETQVGFRRKKSRPYNLMDYSDVSGKHLQQSGNSRRYNSPNMITDIKPEQIMPIQLQAQVQIKQKLQEMAKNGSNGDQ